MSDETSQFNGKCLCGKVTFSASAKPSINACHCGMCRRWSGGPFLGLHVGDAIKFEGESYIGRYRSSEWAERGFCQACGTSLFYYLLPRPNLPGGEYVVPAGTLNEDSMLTFDSEIYIESQPAWYEFANSSSRKQMTEAELMAQFGFES